MLPRKRPVERFGFPLTADKLSVCALLWSGLLDKWSERVEIYPSVQPSDLPVLMRKWMDRLYLFISAADTST
jgi:hypothetical protein